MSSHFRDACLSRARVRLGGGAADYEASTFKLRKSQMLSGRTAASRGCQWSAMGLSRSRGNASSLRSRVLGRVVVPLLVSITDGLLIETVAVSLFTIVPRPLPSSMVTFRPLALTPVN